MTPDDSRSPPSPPDVPVPPADRPASPPRSPWRALMRLSHIVLPIGVLLAAAWGTEYMLQHRVHARRGRPKASATLVEVTSVSLGRERVVVKAMGRVKAAQEVEIHPRVQGEIRALGAALVPGGRVSRGALLVRIDPDDYRLALRQAEATVQLAEADLRVEQGRQVIARRELKLLGKQAQGSDRDLMLRGPQLRKARATLETARAALRRARLNLRRTVIRAPFNAVVLSRDAEVGTRVTESTRLTRLVGTNAYWVELVVPVDQLRWLTIPATAGTPGSRVRLRDPAAWRPGQTREGRVIQLAPDLEEKGRMARLIVQVEDPLALQKTHQGQPRLLLGSWVEAAIQGREIESVAVLPRRLLRDGHRVWLVDRHQKLVIRDVTIAFRDPDHVLVSKGLRPGDRVVVTDIATPVAGMPLRVLKPRAPATPGMTP